MEDLVVYPYKAKLPFAQIVAGKKVTTKEGALVKVGDQALVDLSPFPGFSPYSLKETVKEFKSAFQKGLRTHNNPHVDFALYQLQLQREGLTSKVKVPPCNILLNPLALRESKNLKGVIKTKLRKDTFALILKAIKEHPKVLWRLDGNANFKRDDYLRMEEKLMRFQERIDYIEEPLRDFKDYDACTLSYAHEEHWELYLKERTKACAVVVKPSQVGMSSLKKIKARLILSSCFETPPALHALYYLAKKNAPETHGLGAFTTFENLNWI